MKLTDVLHILEEKVAPVALSDEFCRVYKMYDNSGIIIDSGREVNGAVFSLDLSNKTVAEAKKRGYNLIVTHHPAIYGGISRISADDAVAECVKSGISVISMHLNFDVAPKGIDYHLMRGLGGIQAHVLAGVEGGAYGRVYDINPVKFSEFAENVKKTFSTQRALFYGKDKIIKRVASFCGAGCDERAINFALINGADAFVSSDMKHHEIAGLSGHGVNVIHLTHYSAESYGFEKIYNEISNCLQSPSAFFRDEDLM